MKNKSVIAKILVLSFVVLTIFFNFLANYLPINGVTTGSVSDSIINYVVPASYVFSIWGLIYLSLIGYSIYQFFVPPKYEKTLVEASKWIILSCVANISWIFAWHYMFYGVSVIIMIGLLLTLIKIYETLFKTGSKLVQFPFSLYMGWISVATVVNIAAFLSVIEWNGFGLVPQLWSSILLSIVTILTMWILRIREDLVYASVIVWAVIGIGVNFSDEGYIIGAVVPTLVVIITSMLKTIISKYNFKFK